LSTVLVLPPIPDLVTEDASKIVAFLIAREAVVLPIRELQSLEVRSVCNVLSLEFLAAKT
jgi:hypothetical protein